MFGEEAEKPAREEEHEDLLHAISELVSVESTVSVPIDYCFSH